MKSLEEYGLRESEIEFIKYTYLNPSCKNYNATEYIDDGSEYGENYALWKKPEKLGLIECVGSYKWIPSPKLKMVIMVEV